MGVTFDIIGSILVRTAIVLIVLRMNISLNTMVSETVAHTTIQQELSVLRDVMISDFDKAGLNVTPGTAILTAQSGTFSFKADLDNDGTAETITYYYGAVSELSNTPNPSDRKFYRQIGAGSPLNVANGVTKCQFVYYNSSGTQISSPLSSIKSFSITMTMEEGSFSSKVKSGGTYVDKYPASYWDQIFFPTNL